MKCKACDKTLTDTELKRKDPLTQDYSDLCSRCFKVSQYNVEGVFTDTPTYAFDDEFDFLVQLGVTK